MHEPLMRRLGYQFKTPSLLQMALTHRSAGSHHNERLEFLGDAIVNFVIAETLYQRFPVAREGDLSRLRATLVNRDALCELGRKFELGRFMHLGVGELKSGGSERASILSCAMEAIIGAIYLDAGFDAIQSTLLRWYEPTFATLPEAAALKDPKTRLQEFLQSRGLALPVYSVVASEGEVHQQIFTVACVISGQSVTAQGSSRRRAEQAAAVKMLEKLSHES